MRRLIAIAIGLLCAALPCAAGTYTITPETVDVIAEHGPGHRYVLADGVYDAILIRTPFDANEQGPTVIIAEHRGRAIVRPKTAASNGLCSADIIRPTRLVVDGLVVVGGGADGIRFVDAQHVTIRNCLVANCRGQGIALHRNRDSVIEDCEMANCGIVGDTQRHGVYASGERLMIRRCVAHNNGGYGIHLWEYARGCTVADNTCWANGRAGIVVQTVAGDGERPRPEDGNLIARNWLFGNAVGLQMSRSAFDRLIDNRLWDNSEASVTFQYAQRGPVYSSGNQLDKPAVGTTTQPG